MKWSGNQDCNHYQAKNLKFEYVPSLPTFSSLYLARPMFVTTPGVNYGAWIGGTLGWERFGTGGSAAAYVAIDFHYFSFPANSVGSMAVSGTPFIGHRAILAGSIVGLTLQSEVPVVGGTITGKPSINGIVCPNTDLDVVLSTGTIDDSSLDVPGVPEFSFLEGQKTGIILTSSVAWDNLSSGVLGTLYLYLA